MTEVLRAALAWAAADGPPNAVFVVALLTSPARWSRWAADRVGSYLGGGDGGS